MALPDLLTPPAWTGPVGPVQLPMAVNAQAIAEEIYPLLAIAASWRTIHFYARPWRVDWRAHSLQGYGPETTDIDSPITKQFYRDTAQLEQADVTLGELQHVRARLRERLIQTPSATKCPEAMAVATAIPGITERVRFNALGPGEILPKHRDKLHRPTWEERGIVRFHVPVILPEGCLFFAWDRRGQVHAICERAGDVWFVDTDAPHMVVNATHDYRFHLVVDKFLDDELRGALMASSAGGCEAALR